MAIKPFMFRGIRQKLKRQPINELQCKMTQRAHRIRHDAEHAVRNTRVGAGQVAADRIAHETADNFQRWSAPRDSYALLFYLSSTNGANHERAR